MVNTRGFARLGVLAVGLGIGAAWAHTPVAAADPSSDWLSSIDGLLSGALPAADPSGLNLAISFDGMSLVQDGNATATTASGEYGLAIAYGDGASATAEGGTGNYALADLGNISVADGSNGHFAYAGFGDNNIASVVGDNSYAASGGGFDPAVVGNDNIAAVFDPFGTLGSTAVAAEGLDIPGSFDLAAVFGDGFDTFPAATGGNFLVEILPMLF